MICKKCGEEGKVMYKDKDIDLCFDCLVKRDKEMTSRDAVNFMLDGGKVKSKNNDNKNVFYVDTDLQLRTVDGGYCDYSLFLKDNKTIWTDCTEYIHLDKIWKQCESDGVTAEDFREAFFNNKDVQWVDDNNQWVDDKLNNSYESGLYFILNGPPYIYRIPKGKIPQILQNNA